MVRAAYLHGARATCLAHATRHSSRMHEICGCDLEGATLTKSLLLLSTCAVKHHSWGYQTYRP